MDASAPGLPHLRLPMILAAIGYLIAIVVTFTTLSGVTRSWTACRG
jgi:hypothetical protein